MERRLGKRDFIFIGAISVIAITLLCTYFLTKEPGQKAVVTIDGKTVAQFVLEKDREYTIKTDEGSNHLVIKDGMAFMDEADCPDRVCVQTGTISNEHECIVCLPHGVMVEIQKQQR